MQTTCRRHESETWLEIWLRMTCMSSACHLHIIRVCAHHPHIIQMHAHRPHVICSTPHGQRGPELSS